MKGYKEPHEISAESDLPDFTPELAAQAVRDLLVRQGWHQNSYRSEGGEFCLAGAIRYVYAYSLRPENRTDLMNRIRNLLRKRPEMSGVPDEGLVARWNDAPVRTKKQVLELLRSVEKGFGR